MTLRYRAHGPEHVERLVLLNSLGTDCRIWDGLVDALGDRYRVLRYDQRGQGLSDAPAGPYRIADHADDLLGLLERLSWGPSVLCGLSIGGMIALAARERCPEWVRGLVLSDTSDVIGPRAIWDTRIEQVRNDGLRAISGPVMERWFGASFRRDRPDDVDGWSNLLARAPLEGYVGSCAALRDGDVSGTLAGITVPTLCVCGSEDASTTPEAVRSLASRIPGAEYVEMDGAGHLAPVERPEEFAGLLTSYMESRLAV